MLKKCEFCRNSSLKCKQTLHNSSFHSSSVPVQDLSLTDSRVAQIQNEAASVRLTTHIGIDLSPSGSRLSPYRSRNRANGGRIILAQ